MLILAGFIGKVCVCNIAQTVQCRQDTIVGQSPGAQPQLKIKLLLGFTSRSVQSIVSVGRIGGEPFESIFCKSSLGLNCVVQHLSFLATGENSLGSFHVLSQARY